MLKNPDGETYGPYNSNQLLAYAKEGRINTSSQLKHDVKTKGEWVSVIKLKAIFDAIPTPSLPSETVSQPPAFREQSALFDAIEKGRKQQKGSSMNSAPPPGFVAFILAFLDPTFKYYVTPAIICITCCFLLFLLVASAAIESFLWLQPISSEPAIMQASSTKNSFSDYYPLFRIVASVLLDLWIRVLLESGIVLFDISNTLKRIAAKS